MKDDLLLRTLADALDGLDVALCVFDDEDRTQLWNRAFLRTFPEHAGHVHAGEPYRANLRRFYEARLSPAELGDIDRLIDEGVARHRGTGHVDVSAPTGLVGVQQADLFHHRLVFGLG